MVGPVGGGGGGHAAALDLLAKGRTPTVPALWAAAQRWDDARAGRPQVFGIRFARYPMTRHDGGRLLANGVPWCTART